MDKIINFVSNELDDLEEKAGKGKLTAAEVQYIDTLAHLKKNLLTAEAMEDGYSQEPYYRGNSYARKRDSMGRYSRMDDGMVEDLHELMNRAPDMETKREFKKFIGNSYARKRDSMGRYSRRYSRMDDGMVEDLHELMNRAPDMETKREFKKFISKIESM